MEETEIKEKVKKPRKFGRRISGAVVGLAALVSGAFAAYSYGWFSSRNIHDASFERDLLVANPDYRIENYKNIQITGNAKNIGRTKTALDLIMEISEEDWRLVDENITNVTFVKNGQVSWDYKGHMDIGNGRFYLKESFLEESQMPEEDKIKYCASALIHDALHRDLWRKGEEQYLILSSSGI